MSNLEYHYTNENCRVLQVGSTFFVMELGLSRMVKLSIRGRYKPRFWNVLYGFRVKSLKNDSSSKV